jgi:tetratricopeptide (TPR) repeat protein
MSDRNESVIRRMKLKTTLSVFLCVFLFAAFFTETLQAQSLDTAEVMELYRQAREMFRQANEMAASDPDQAEQLYRNSAMRFEKIVWQGGIRNGEIFYNIGNAYFKMGDIGRAILNYKRAALFMPNDLNLRQNLHFAKARRIDRIEEPQRMQVLKILFFWHYDLSSHTRMILFSAFFILFWVFAGFRLFFSKSFLNWLILFLAGFAFLFLGSLIIDTIYHYNRDPGVIVSLEVIARKGDSVSYESSFKEPLHSGTEFTLIEKRGSWFHIELPDSRRCWIPETDVELVMFNL